MLYEELAHYVFTTTFVYGEPPYICETTFSKTVLSKKDFFIASFNSGLLIDAFLVGQ